MRIHQPSEQIEDANTALQMLKEGNERYLKGEPIDKTCCCSDRDVLCECQKPFAVILTCSDSRVVPEIFFDQKLGDIFIIRNAGNVADKTSLGAIEYAVEYLNCKLIAVCGHSDCRAVFAACSDREFSPNITHIVKHIEPAIKKNRSLDENIRSNILYMADIIRADESIRREGLMIAGAYYDLKSGIVSWL